MVWTFRITFLLFLAWLVFLASPFVALYDLAKAVETRDLARIEERVNFRAVRTSLTRQIVGEYLKTDAGRELGGFDRRTAENAGAAVVDPFIERLVTPQALIDLLDDGWPQQAAGNRRSASSEIAFGITPGFNADFMRRAWNVFIASQSQGFRSITIPLPDGEAKDRQFRLTFRLSGLTWKLTGIDLPDNLRRELIRRSRIAVR